MNEVAGNFLLWCREHGNSPDVMNLRWWLENRTTLTFSEAQIPELMVTIKTIKELCG